MALPPLAGICSDRFRLVQVRIRVQISLLGIAWVLSYLGTYGMYRTFGGPLTKNGPTSDGNKPMKRCFYSKKASIK